MRYPILCLVSGTFSNILVALNCCLSNSVLCYLNMFVSKFFCATVILGDSFSSLGDIFDHNRFIMIWDGPFLEIFVWNKGSSNVNIHNSEYNNRIHLFVSAFMVTPDETMLQYTLLTNLPILLTIILHFFSSSRMKIRTMNHNRKTLVRSLRHLQTAGLIFIWQHSIYCHRFSGMRF